MGKHHRPRNVRTCINFRFRKLRVNLGSTGSHNHFFLSSDQIQISILVEPAYVASSNSVPSDECLLSFAISALKIGGGNSVFANSDHFSIGSKFHTDSW